MIATFIGVGAALVFFMMSIGFASRGGYLRGLRDCADPLGIGNATLTRNIAINTSGCSVCGFMTVVSLVLAIWAYLA